jgi:hypothetical protein
VRPDRGTHLVRAQSVRVVERLAPAKADLADVPGKTTARATGPFPERPHAQLPAGDTACFCFLTRPAHNKRNDNGDQRTDSHIQHPEPDIGQVPWRP